MGSSRSHQQVEMASALTAVLSLCKAVASQARRAKSNRQRAQRLGDRVTYVAEALSQLEGTQLDASTTRQLGAVKVVLDDATAFITKLSDSSWLVRLWNAGEHTEHFDDINQRLSQAMEGFHFARDVQRLLLDRQEDAADDEQDLPEITTQLESAERELKTQGGGAAADVEKLRHQRDVVQRRLLMSQELRKRAEEDMSKFELDPSHVQVDEASCLGQGASAVVYRGELNYEPVAVKVAHTRRRPWTSKLHEATHLIGAPAQVFKSRMTAEQRASLLKEVSLMASAAHSSLVSVRCVRPAVPADSCVTTNDVKQRNISVQGQCLHHHGAAGH
jgi:hypothetical protein